MSAAENQRDDAGHARAALEALAVLLDGSKAAVTTFRRKRGVLHHALEYAVEPGELQGNPLDRIKWTRPSTTMASTAASS